MGKRRGKGEAEARKRRIGTGGEETEKDRGQEDIVKRHKDENQHDNNQ